MGADGVVMALVFSDQVFQMVFPENHELAEAFLLYTLNEPFRERVQIWASVFTTDLRRFPSS